MEYVQAGLLEHEAQFHITCNTTVNVINGAMAFFLSLHADTDVRSFSFPLRIQHCAQPCDSVLVSSSVLW